MQCRATAYAAIKTEKQVDQWTEKSAAKDVEILTHIAKIQAPLWEERSKVLKDVEGFWPDALFNCLPFVIYMIGEDRPLLKHITDIRVLRDLNEIRNLRLEFDFSDNAYFSDKTLVKEFVAKKDAPQIGEEFDWVEHLIAKKTTINWKSEDKNLAKKHPSQTADEDGEFGSLFASFFENDKGDPAPAIGEIIAFTFFPNAIDYYTGKTSE